jgi:hypothetical protein
MSRPQAAMSRPQAAMFRPQAAVSGLGVVVNYLR